MAEELLQEKIYTAAELAKRWRCDVRTIANRVTAGDLKAFRVGALLRFLESDVRAFEASGGQRRKPAAVMG